MRPKRIEKSPDPIIRSTTNLLHIASPAADRGTVARSLQVRLWLMYGGAGAKVGKIY